MRSLAVCGRSIPAIYPHSDSIESISIDGVRIVCGVLDSPDRAFDPSLPESARKVLVRVRRFSCNYRDKAFILRAATYLPRDRFLVIGSEFVGDVVAVGRDVRRVCPGDRVMGDNSYPHLGPGDSLVEPHGGVPTNGASGEYLVLHEDKVIGVPAAMPDDVAAAFSLGAQTAFSMVAKLSPERGAAVLVTAATSNTSLFAMEALRQHEVRVYATTSSERHLDRLRARGVQDVFVAERGRPFTTHDELVATARRIGGFTGVIDPFFDLHLLKVLPLMRNGGRYVSCGLHGQGRVGASATGSATVTEHGADYHGAVCIAIVKNIAIMGNCVGLRTHLEQAVSVYERGGLDVAIDSVFADGRAGAFLSRTFSSPERFGKVVYAYA